MTPYYALLGFAALFARAADRFRPGRPTLFFSWLAAGLLVVFAGLRYRTGTDYATYRLIFNRINPDDWWGTVVGATQEPGFTLLQLAIKSFTDSPVVFFVVASALCVVPTALAFHTLLRDHLALAWFAWVGLAFYLTSFNTVRQAIAVALLLWASTFLPKRPLAFTALALVAGSFHVTALFAAIALALTRRWTPSLTQAGIVLGGSAVVAIGGMAGLTPFLSSISTRYAGYVLQPSETGVGAWLQTAVFAALLVAAWRGGLARGDADRQRHMTWVLIGVGVMVIGTQAVVLFRLSTYFTVFAIFLLPALVSHARRPRLVAAALALGIVLYFTAHLLNYDGLVPYRSEVA